MPSPSACRRSAREPRGGVARHDLAAAGAGVEIIEDDARVVERGAVLGDKHRNFAERILQPDAVGGVAGVGGFDLHVVVEAEPGNRYPHLAPERRGRRGTQNHHGSTIIESLLRRDDSRGNARSNGGRAAARCHVLRRAPTRCQALPI